MRKMQGITLVALVVTIIILLILAGVVINISLKENGILQRSELAKQETQIASNEEDNGMKYYENEIQKRANENQETITINKQEYEELKNEVKELKENFVPKSISEDSVLMNSTNTTLSVGTLTLKNFTNEFSDNFTEYFSYDETTGEITCQKEGWYCVDLTTDLRITSSWASVSLLLFVNNVEIGRARSIVEQSSWTDNDTNSISIYLKREDKVKVEKITGNANPVRNGSVVKIIKL